MKWTSSLVDTLSGKLGGRVASTSRGGVGYFRSLVLPRNPRSPLQMAVRAAMTSAAVYWATILSEADQESFWDIATGSQTGQTIFTKINQPRVYAYNSGRLRDNLNMGPYTNVIDYVLTPPLTLSTGLTAPTGIVIDDSANTLAFTCNAADEWNSDTIAANEEAILYVYCSHQQSASRFSRQHSYQLAGAFVRGEADDPIATITYDLATLGFTTTVGKVMYVKFVAQRKDGSISIPIERRITIQA